MGTYDRGNIYEKLERLAPTTDNSYDNRHDDDNKQRDLYEWLTHKLEHTRHTDTVNRKVVKTATSQIVKGKTRKKGRRKVIPGKNKTSYRTNYLHVYLQTFTHDETALNKPYLMMDSNGRLEGTYHGLENSDSKSMFYFSSLCQFRWTSMISRSFLFIYFKNEGQMLGTLWSLSIAPWSNWDVVFINTLEIKNN